jgi:hypothetical protein
MNRTFDLAAGLAAVNATFDAAERDMLAGREAPDERDFVRAQVIVQRELMLAAARADHALLAMGAGADMLGTCYGVAVYGLVQRLRHNPVALACCLEEWAELSAGQPDKDTLVRRMSIPVEPVQ